MIVCEEGGSKTGEQRQTTLTSCLASVSRLGQADPSEAQLGLAADLLTVSFFQGQQRACPSHHNKKSAGKDQLCQRRASPASADVPLAKRASTPANSDSRVSKKKRPGRLCHSVLWIRQSKN